MYKKKNSFSVHFNKKGYVNLDKIFSHFYALTFRLKAHNSPKRQFILHFKNSGIIQINYYETTDKGSVV